MTISILKDMKIIHQILKWFLAILKFLVRKVFVLLRFILWFILAPIDMFITIFIPNTIFHKWINGFYNQNVRTTLTKDISARASYTFAHGFLHIIIFIIVALCSWYIFNLNTSVVKNKYIKVTTFSKTGHKFKGIWLNWAQTWNMEEGELPGSFSLKFSPDLNAIGDTANYYVSIHSNFDIKPDTSCFPNLKKIDYHVIHNKPNSIEVEINRPNLEFGDDEFAQQVTICSNAKVFDDDDTPYVNFFIEFDCQALAPDTAFTNSRIDIYFNTEFEDGFGNMPYDIQIAKPESRYNCPWWLSYTSQDDVMDVLNHGLYVSTVNRDLKQKKDQESFLYSVIIGALVSFLFSIIINLFTKWRNLNLAEGKSNPYT